MKGMLLLLLALCLGGCATVGQKNHGQPFVLPEALKTQVVGKKLFYAEHGQSGCGAFNGELVSPTAAWSGVIPTPRAQLGEDGYFVEYIYWGCEEDIGGNVRRHLGNYVAFSFTAGIIPYFYDSYANLTARVYKGNKMVFEGKYRELTRNKMGGWIIFPVQVVQMMKPRPVKESHYMTAYRNLARQFVADLATEYVFE